VFLFGSSLLSSTIPYYIGVLLNEISAAKDNPNPDPNAGSLSYSHMYFLAFIIFLSIATYFRTVTTQIVQ
jgi:hypothetical protein